MRLILITTMTLLTVAFALIIILIMQPRPEQIENRPNPTTQWASCEDDDGRVFDVPYIAEKPAKREWEEDLCKLYMKEALK